MAVDDPTKFDETLGPWRRMHCTPEELAYIRALERLRASASPANPLSPAVSADPTTEQAKEYLSPGSSYFQHVERIRRETEELGRSLRELGEKDRRLGPGEGGLHEGSAYAGENIHKEVSRAPNERHEGQVECAETSVGKVKQPTKPAAKRKRKVCGNAHSPALESREADSTKQPERLPHSQDVRLQTVSGQKIRPRKSPTARTKRTVATATILEVGTEMSDKSRGTRRQKKTKNFQMAPDFVTIASSNQQNPTLPVKRTGDAEIATSFGYDDCECPPLQRIEPSLSYQRQTRYVPHPMQANIPVLSGQPGNEGYDSPENTANELPNLNTSMPSCWSSHKAPRSDSRRFQQQAVYRQPQYDPLAYQESYARDMQHFCWNHDAYGYPIMHGSVFTQPPSAMANPEIDQSTAFSCHPTHQFQPHRQNRLREVHGDADTDVAFTVPYDYGPLDLQQNEGSVRTAIKEMSGLPNTEFGSLDGASSPKSRSLPMWERPSDLAHAQASKIDISNASTRALQNCNAATKSTGPRGQSPQRSVTMSRNDMICHLSQPTVPSFGDFHGCDGNRQCSYDQACNLPCGESCEDEGCRSCDDSQICCEPCGNPELCSSPQCDDPKCLEDPQSSACVGHHTPSHLRSSQDTRLSVATGCVDPRDVNLHCYWETMGEPCEAWVQSTEELSQHVQEQHIQPQAHIACQWNHCANNIDMDDLQDHLWHYHSPTATSNLYFCLWDGCGLTFASAHELGAHMNAVHCQMSCHWDGCEQEIAGELALKEHVDFQHITKAGAHPSGSTTPTSDEVYTPRTPEMPSNKVLWKVAPELTTAATPSNIPSPQPLPVLGNSGSKTCQWTSYKGACGQVFADGNALQSHVEATHVNDLKHTRHAPNICSWAGCKTSTPFSERSKLARHLYTHTKFVVGACRHCGKEFNNKNQLANHERTHTDEKPFGCAECGWKASNKAALTTHMRIHTGAKPLKCDKCSYTCGDPSNMSKHRKTHVPPLHKCHLCDKAFCRMSTLKRHMRSHDSNTGAR